MRLLLIIYTFSSAALASTFEIIDVDGLCYIYSNRIWGCTGSSKPIGPLNGTSCSHLSVKNNGNWLRQDTINVTACGPARDTDHEQAYIVADQSGLLIFQNTAGNTANCTIGEDFHVGSICTALEDGWSTQKAPVATPPTNISTETPLPSRSTPAPAQTRPSATYQYSCE
ncbi:uncharacterized protein N7483_002560 [Penicillium malachiteum]|uniref:uncharacterized protein n=1 Tax=Penicillium malachiteum TaxID=1324776 RepID=UPI002546A31F|nr:uncharacterized protein N7483_002560 [Penicillium malachiteum]KAJ5737435.1 hypothetical protein N7483_002560 [Penicillium malachiteum]